MKTVDKAITLLGFFSEDAPEIGLSDLARMANFDKATTRRLLMSLAKHGIVEQHHESKKYRLGAGVVRLARVREATMPIQKIIEPILERLVEKTGETVSSALFAGTELVNVGLLESSRANRVILASGRVLPLHSTASGIVFLAFSPPELVSKLLAQPLAARTNTTVTDPKVLRKMIDTARRTGVAVADQSFEEEVYGIAAPIFDSTGFACGAVAVLTPISRISEAVEQVNRAATISASIEITRALGAEPHPQILKAHAEFLEMS